MADPTSGAGRVARRYGPFVLLVAVVAAVIVAADGRGGRSTGDQASTGPVAASSLPLTFQEAAAKGVAADIDWGQGCDTSTGRVAIPLTDAAPCVEWDPSSDNGGATSPGVTGNEILVVRYQGKPSALQTALVADAGADTDPARQSLTANNYLTLFADVYQTYGRSIRVENVQASGGPEDPVAALADAQKIIDLHPFAVIGGPGQTPAFWQEIVNARIVCVACGAGTEPWDGVERAAPYLWSPGPNPDQLDAHLLELVGKQLVGRPATFGGDDVNGKERTFGWIQTETEAGEYRARLDAFSTNLRQQYGAEISSRFSYIFDASRAGEIAATAVARMKEAGVTTVILSTDPLIPASITKEATAQGYFPEWVLGPSVLLDSTLFGRRMDPQQWSHMLGLSIGAARASREQSDSYLVYDWYFGEPPPVSSQAAQMAGPHTLLRGIHLAGPDLTPETFRDGLFRSPLGEAGLTHNRESWGDALWGRPDYNGGDDAGAIWWDADATGPDEAGNAGTGMIRYVEGGKRWLPGEWPTDPLPFFDRNRAVAIYDQRPDGPPSYPAWPGSPAARG